MVEIRSHEVRKDFRFITQTSKRGTSYRYNNETEKKWQCQENTGTGNPTTMELFSARRRLINVITPIRVTPVRSYGTSSIQQEEEPHGQQ